MPTITDWGTMDGKPAKIVRNPQNGKVDIYWDGRGSADGPGHSHVVINDNNPGAVRYMRVNGRVIADDHQPAHETRHQRQLRERGGYLGIFRTALRNALRMSGLGGGRRW